MRRISVQCAMKNAKIPGSLATHATVGSITVVSASLKETLPKKMSNIIAQDVEKLMIFHQSKIFSNDQLAISIGYHQLFRKVQ